MLLRNSPPLVGALGLDQDIMHKSLHHSMILVGYTYLFPTSLLMTCLLQVEFRLMPRTTATQHRLQDPTVCLLHLERTITSPSRNLGFLSMQIITSDLHKTCAKEYPLIQHHRGQT